MSSATAKLYRAGRMKLSAWDEDKDANVMAIHTGLSVTVCGHLIRLDRDESAQRARIVVEVINGHVVTGLEVDAVSVAADLLAARARRFLGKKWTVEAWRANRRLPEVGA